MLRNIVTMHSQGCVKIVKKTDNNNVMFLGTGFLCHNNGYIATCAHLINLTDKLAMVQPQPINTFNPLIQSKVNIFDLRVVQFDPQNDVALLKIINPPLLRVPDNLFGDEDTVLVGTSVGYLGYPFGDKISPLKASISIISSKALADNNTTKQFQLDTMVHNGNSGGPLIELASGKIIGIICGRFSPTGNSGAVINIGGYNLGTESVISFANTINYLKALLKSEGLL